MKKIHGIDTDSRNICLLFLYKEGLKKNIEKSRPA